MHIKIFFKLLHTTRDLQANLTLSSYFQPPNAVSNQPPAIMSGDKSYTDSAKEALNSAQQKASDTLGSVKDTLTGSVSPLCLTSYVCPGVRVLACACLPCPRAACAGFWGRSKRVAMGHVAASFQCGCCVYYILRAAYAAEVATQTWACCQERPLGSRSRSKFLCLDAGVCFAQAKSAQDKAGDYTQAAKDKAGDLTGSAKDTSGSAQDKAGDYAQTAKEKTSSAADTAGQKVS